MRKQSGPHLSKETFHPWLIELTNHAYKGKVPISFLTNHYSKTPFGRPKMPLYCSSLKLRIIISPFQLLLKVFFINHLYITFKVLACYPSKQKSLPLSSHQIRWIISIVLQKPPSLSLYHCISFSFSIYLFVIHRKLLLSEHFYRFFIQIVTKFRKLFH